MHIESLSHVALC